MKFPGKHWGLLMPEITACLMFVESFQSNSHSRSVEAGGMQIGDRLKRGKRNATLEVA